jgi:predicted nucleotidyltransferase
MVSPKLKAEIDRLQRQLDEIDAAAVLEALQDFITRLSPEHRVVLRRVLWENHVTEFDDISDAELDRLLIENFDDDDLRLLLELRGDDVRRLWAERTGRNGHVQ